MRDAMHSDQLRVTSISFTSSNIVIFSGVPLKRNSYKTNSGKYYITVITAPEAIPVQPAVGQRWAVKGLRRVQVRETGDYLMQQHPGTNPLASQLSLLKQLRMHQAIN